MTKGKNRRPPIPSNGGLRPAPAGPFTSMFDQMVDGREYQSIVNVQPPANADLVPDLQTGLGAISRLRERPCIAYVGNVSTGTADSSVNPKDDLPFMEMVQAVPPEHRKVDVFLATNGGSGTQIARFVNFLRSRFDEVDFLIPSFCMSAGTLFALSGDRIWMTPQASLGPIDPQSANQVGRFVPSQALLLLVEKLQKEGQSAMEKGQPVPWTAVRIIDTIDKKDLGDAYTASAYSINLATQFLMNYKFKDWLVRDSSGQAVTPEYRQRRAQEIAAGLASHDRWKSHGHSIQRDVLWNEICLKIEHPDAALERAIRRVWAYCYWLFDRTAIQKMIFSETYAFITFNQQGVQK